MTALFINIKIDQEEKFDLFKITLTDIENVFDECHIKIRGNLANECIAFAKRLFLERAIFYQDLQENDWVAASLVMVENIKSRSIFSYLEDHRLVKSQKNLSLVLSEFDKQKLDYLVYSFFRASRLAIENILPLNPKNGKIFSEFLLNKKNINLIRKISPNYFTFSSASISSVSYFKKLLNDENKKYKIYSRKLSTLLSIIFRFPKNRVLINFLNLYFSHINLKLCFYPPNSPFNMEKMNIEMTSFQLNSLQESLKFGILKDELFANFDDDNTAYGESLIKRGLYPFDTDSKTEKKTKNKVIFNLNLRAGDKYDCTYYSQLHRIRKSPIVSIKVNYGSIVVYYKSKKINLNKNDNQAFFSNLSPMIDCTHDAEINLTLYDECFT